MAPADELLAMAEGCEEGGTFNAANVADGVLADWLDDHNDLRAAIVRQDLSFRSNAVGGYRYSIYSRTLNARIEELTGCGDFIGVGQESERSLLPDGTAITVTVHTPPDYWERQAVKLSWQVPSAGGPNIYNGVFAPDEAESILSQLGLKLPE